MNNKTIKLSTYFLGLGAVLSLILFISISTQRWRVHDDWLFVVRMNKMGLIPFCFEYYKTWDARFVFPVFIVYWGFIKYFGFKATLVFCSICFIACNFLLVKIVCKTANLKLKSIQLLIATTVFTFAIWFSMRVVMVDTLYWMTAGVYIFTLLINLTWLYLWVKNKYALNKMPIWFYILTFCVATSTQNISVGLAFIVFISFWYNKKILNIKNNKPLLVVMAIFIVGIGISSISKGSMVQFNGEITSNYGLEEKAGIKALIMHWFKLYVDAFTSLGLVFYVCLFGLAISIFGFAKNANFNLNIGFELPKSISFKSIITHMYINVFIYAAFWSLLIYWPTPLLSPRYYIGFYAYLTLHILNKLLKSNNENNTNENENVLGSVISACFILMSLLVYRNSYINSKIMNNFRAERDAQMQLYANKASYIKVPGFMDNTCPILVKTEEVSDDSSYIYNLILQDYFKIKTIKTGEFIKWHQLIENKNRMKEFVKEKTTVEQWQK